MHYLSPSKFNATHAEINTIANSIGLQPIITKTHVKCHQNPDPSIALTNRLTILFCLGLSHQANIVKTK